MKQKIGLLTSGESKKIKDVSLGVLDLESSNSAAVHSVVRNNFNSYQIISVRNEKDLDNVDKLIIPGVGRIGQVMKEISTMHLQDGIQKFAESGRHLLGICLGMQILGLESEEDETQACLGILDFSVIRMIPTPTDSVPHNGWNSVNFIVDCALTRDIETNSDFYFSHSFAVGNSDFSVGITNHGKEFVSIVSKENVHGVQFHPEKSQGSGVKLLSNFLRL